MAAKKGKRRTAKAAAKMDVVEFGHNVWLAGLGAISRTRTEGPKLFESLVEEGAMFQEQTRDSTGRALKELMSQVRSNADERVSSIRGKASDTWDNVEKIFQSRVQKALQQIGMPSSQEIRALTRKVDELTQAVEAARKRDRRTTASTRAHSTSAQQGAAV